MKYLICQFRYVQEPSPMHTVDTEDEAKAEIDRLAKGEEEGARGFFASIGDPMYYTYIPVGSAE